MGTRQLTPDQEICQKLADVYTAVASSAGHAITTRRLRRALVSAISAVYDLSQRKARRVVIVMADSGDDVASCAEGVRTRRQSTGPAGRRPHHEPDPKENER